MTAVDDFIQNPGVGLFAPDALVHDNGREFRGARAIGRWLDDELHAVNATMSVREREEIHGIEVVTAAVDGTFDKTGLPDPLVLTYYFRHEGGTIGALFIVRNEQRHAE